MRRRDFVKAMAVAVAAPNLLFSQTGKAINPAPPPPAPVPWTLGLNGATPIPATQLEDTVAQASLRLFTPSQMATLERLSDVLVPSLGDKPGALAAETPAFLDFLIGSSPADRRQMYQGGLDWLDTEAKKQYSRSFVALDPTQVDHILQPWMRTWMTDHPPTEPHADFINIAHADIRNATVNSKVWSDSAKSHAPGRTNMDLYWSPIEPDLAARYRSSVPTSREGAR